MARITTNNFSITVKVLYYVLYYVSRYHFPNTSKSLSWHTYFYTQYKLIAHTIEYTTRTLHSHLWGSIISAYKNITFKEFWGFSKLVCRWRYHHKYVALQRVSLLALSIPVTIWHKNNRIPCPVRTACILHLTKLTPESSTTIIKHSPLGLGCVDMFMHIYQAFVLYVITEKTPSKVYWRLFIISIIYEVLFS